MGIENDNDYQDAIKKFKEYVYQTNADESNKTHKGFLIDYTEFLKLEKKLENKENNNGSCESTSNNRPNLTPQKPTGLKNKINNGDKFVLINNDLYEKICDRNLDPKIHIIQYKISKDCINLYGENNEVLKFKKSDINLIEIDKSSSDELKTVNINCSNNVDKIYIDVLNYYKIEKNFQINFYIQNEQEVKSEGFFVDKIWDDKWKKYSYYDSIKTKCLQNNILDKNTIIKMIKEEQTKNYLNYDEVNDVENYLAKNEMEVYNSIKNLNKSYVILNKEFFKQFTIKTNILPISFYLSFQNISIKPAGQTILYCKTNNNIISKNNNVIEPQNQNQHQNQIQEVNTPNNNLYSLEYLKHLIRAIYFKAEILLPNSKFKEGIISAFLIKKDIIKDLKAKFQLNELILKIENNPKLAGISYRNFKDKFPSILEAINESYCNYLKSIEQYNNPGVINYTLAQSILQEKNINGLGGLNYIDNFEIIDGGFAAFLQKAFYQKLHLPSADFTIIDNYILLMTNLNNKYFYEILSFSCHCELTVEYLINIISYKFNDISQFNKYIFQYFINNGIKKLISSENPIQTENDNIIFNI